MLGISTCWFENRSLNGEEIIKEILELGLEGVELEYRITHPIYQQMKPLLNKTIKVLSIHNYFPKPIECSHLKASGDLFLLSSVDKDERTKAIQYTIRTLEHACDLEVVPVILHLGHVDMPNPFVRIKRYYSDKKLDQEESVAYIREQNITRRNKVSKHLDAVLFSLERLNKEAEKKGIMLCVENRYHLHEVPDFQEIGIILNEFRGGHIRYWHDVGHAAAQERMGLCRQKDLLDAYSDFIMGVHIHDIKGLDDHLSPGKGDLDFRELSSFNKSDTFKILEIDSNVPRDELEGGIQFVQRELEWR
jgi:sugar phosphate isomerase/epimerase